jgi:hypothetical protein
MQHIDEPLKRYEPVIPDYAFIAEMYEISDGEYVKYEDVKKFLALIAMKVRML